MIKQGRIKGKSVEQHSNFTQKLTRKEIKISGRIYTPASVSSGKLAKERQKYKDQKFFLENHKLNPGNTAYGQKDKHVNHPP